MFWDICAPRPWPTRGRQRRNPWRILTEFPTPSNTSTWKPRFRVSLPKINTDAEYSPLKFSLRDNTCDNHTGRNAADGATVESIRSFKFFSVHITKDLKWSLHTDSMALQRLLQPQEAEEVWPLRPSQFSTDAPLRAFCWVVSSHGMGTGTAQRIIGGTLSALQDFYSTRCHRKAKKIIKDLSHLSHGLFDPLPSRDSTCASKLGQRD
ncbi:uncharacterized protein LOC112250426 isoform X2 [Oncorhynchus tshawytscha]|nr:uncharacterized protein LOC112250426 isoform X2 [Oncorhynchus tshawytscha]